MGLLAPCPCTLSIWQQPATSSSSSAKRRRPPYRYCARRRAPASQQPAGRPAAGRGRRRPRKASRGHGRYQPQQPASASLRPLMNPGYCRSRPCLVRRGSVGAERCGSRCERERATSSSGPCQLQQEAVVPFALNSWPVTLLHAAQQRLAFAKLFLPTALYGGLDCDVVGSVGKRVKGQVRPATARG
jgi:hypothetical protein